MKNHFGNKVAASPWASKAKTRRKLISIREWLMKNRTLEILIFLVKSQQQKIKTSCFHEFFVLWIIKIFFVKSQCITFRQNSTVEFSRFFFNILNFRNFSREFTVDYSESKQNHLVFTIFFVLRIFTILIVKSQLHYGQAKLNCRVFTTFFILWIFVIFLVKSQWITVNQSTSVLFSRIFSWFEFSQYFSLIRGA